MYNPNERIFIVLDERLQFNISYVSCRSTYQFNRRVEPIADGLALRLLQHFSLKLTSRVFCAILLLLIQRSESVVSPFCTVIL